MSLESLDKIKVEVKKEIFISHLISAKDDEIMFIDMSTVDSPKKLRVPKQMSTEEAYLIKSMS